MTREDKQLLLEDLSARLLYGVIGLYSWKNHEPYNRELTGCLFDELKSSWDSTEDSQFLPYLRPMSSMTEEEEINLYKVTGFYYLSNNELQKDEWYSFKNSIKENKLFFPYPIWLDDLQKVFDWLNKYHFDYRGWIEKGMVISTEEFNPYK